MTTQVKVCGITTIDDALCAAAAGVDALGFIFHPPSPRFITPERATRIVAALPAPIVTVGVFVNRPPEEVLRIAEGCGLDLIQLHGDERPRDCRRFPAGRLLKAIFPRTPEDLAATAAYDVRAFLVDARQGARYGGTGKRADWDLAAAIARRHPLILAGGLDETNVAEALKAVNPAALDLNSGVERAPGVKDPEKLRRAIDRIRAADSAKPAAGAAAFAKADRRAWAFTEQS